MANKYIALCLSLMLGISLFPVFPKVEAAPGINQQIPFYGTLKDNEGTELSGSFDMVFRFYDAGTGGTLLDTSTHTAANSNPVTVSSGEFEVLLGSGTGNALDGIDFNDDTIFVGLTIGSDSEMTPRTRLGAAAYAFNADTVDGYEAADFQLVASSTNFIQNNATATLATTTIDHLIVNAGIFLASTTPASTTDTIYNLGGTLYFNGTSLGGGNPFGPSIDESELNISGAPTDGFLLQASSTSAGGFVWVATSTLGISSGSSLFTDAGTFTYVTDAGEELSVGTSTIGNAKLTVQSEGASDILNLFETDGQEVFTVLENGNVGIGTSSPVSALSVIGTTTMSQGISFTGTGNRRIGFDEGVGRSLTVAAADDGDDQAGTLFLLAGDGLIGGDVIINSGTGGFGNGQIQFNNGLTINNSGQLSSGALLLDSLSYTGTLDDTNINDMLTIGAGSTIADGLLVEADLNIGAPTDGYLLQASSSAAGGWEWVATSTLGLGGETTFLGLTDTPSSFTANALVFASSTGSELTQSSNLVYTGTRLGLGIAVPQTTFHMAADGPVFRFDDTDDSLSAGEAAGVISFHQSVSDSPEESARIEAYSASGGEALNLGLFTAQAAGSAQERLTIAADGSIGIGTTSPTALLTIAGTPGSFDQGLMFGDGDTGVYESTDDTMVLYFGDTGTNRWSIDSSRIQSTNGTGARITYGGLTGPGNPIFSRSSDIDTGIYSTGNANELGISTGGTARMLFDANGNIGIGTTTPDSRLTVAGEINIASTSSGLSVLGDRVFTASTTNRSIAIGLEAGEFFAPYLDEGFNPAYHIAIGYQAGQQASSSGTFDNIFIGRQAGQNVSDFRNIAIGDRAGLNSSQDNLVAIGSGAGSSNAGVNNTFIGHFSGQDVAGARMVALGTDALNGAVSADGSNSVAVGYRAGFGITTATNNIFLGYQAGNSLTSGSNNIIIGYDVEAPSNTASNQLNIGNLIFGTGVDGVGTNVSSGGVGIGTTTGANARLSLQSQGVTDILNLFETDGTEVFTVLENGNVGIGTTSPNSLLSLAAAEDTALLALADSSNARQANLYMGTTSPNGRIAAPIGSLFINNSSGELFQNTNGNTLWNPFTQGTTTHSAKMTRDAVQTIAHSGNRKIEFDNIDYDIGGIADATTNDRFDIKKSGRYLVNTTWCVLGSFQAHTYVYVNGVNAGGQYHSDGSSGTNFCPTYSEMFDLSVGDYVEMYVYVFNSDEDTLTSDTTKPTMSVTEIAPSGGIGIDQFTNSGANTYLTEVSDNILLGTTTNTGNAKLVVRQQNASDIVNIFDGDKEIFTILDGGNVGIGTTSPASMLDVWGDFRVGTSVTPNLFVDTSANFVSVGTTTQFGSALLSVAGDIALEDNFLSNTGSDSNGLRFGNDGYLELVGNSGSNIVFEIDNTNPSASSERTLRFAAGGTNFGEIGVIRGDSANTDMTFDVRNGSALTEVMRIDGSSASISIGTTTTSAKLSIQATSTNDILNLFEAGGLEVLSVLESGNLGLGITSPSEKLTIFNGDQSFVQAAPEKVAGLSFTTLGGMTVYNNYLYTSTQGYIFDISAPETSFARVTDSDLDFDDIAGEYAYGIASNALQISSLADPKNPTLVSTTSIPGTGTVRGVKVQGQYAYIVSDATADDLQIFDIADPYNPFEVGGVNLASHATGGFIVDGQYVYIGVEGAGDRMTIVDVSDPANPVALSSFQRETGNISNEVQALHDDHIFYSAENNLYLVDVTDPLNPTEVASTTLLGEILSVAITNNTAFVGTGNLQDALYVFNISDKSDFDFVASTTASADVNGLLIHGSYLYLTSNSQGDDIEVFDIAGITAPSAQIGTLLADRIDTFDLSARSADFSGALNVGNNAFVNGTLAIGGTASATVTSVGVPAFSVLKGDVALGTSTSRARLTVQSEGTEPVFSLLETDGQEVLTVLESGNVGLGTSTPDQTLDVIGTIQASNLLGGATTLSTDANGNIIRTTSDERLKENIIDIENGLDVVLGLRGVRYDWIDEERFGEQTEVGFIAQEVNEVLPEVVRQGGDYWSLNTPNILAVVVEAIQEVWEVVTGNRTKITELEGRLEALESQLASSSPAAVVAPVVNDQPEDDETARESDPDNGVAPEVDNENEEERATTSERVIEETAPSENQATSTVETLVETPAEESTGTVESATTEPGEVSEEVVIEEEPETNIEPEPEVIEEPETPPEPLEVIESEV